MEMARREFLRLAHAGMAALPLATFAETQPPKETPPVRLGLIGCGGRGTWISHLFKTHGGFIFTAVADYFPERAKRVGGQLGIPESRCFSGLEGYKRLIAADIDAVVLQVPPYFFPAYAEEALDAKRHLYIAKPIAIDIPGTLKMKELIARATREQRVLMADYQMPKDPVNQEVTRRIRAGALGRLQMIFSSGWAGGNGYQDPPREASPANRIKDLVWCNDLPLGGDYIVHYDVHILDAVVRALGKIPQSAMGIAAAFRPSVHGDAMDSTSVIYRFDDGTPWTHQGILGAYHDWMRAGRLTASLQGTQATACLSYAGKSYVRGGPRHFSGGVPNPEGSVRTNIDTFWQNITQGNCANEDAAAVIGSNLTAILGREAARRSDCLTLDELIRENKALTPDLSALTR